MPGIHDFWLFVASGLLLNITPGPDTAYIIGRSAQFGWRGGAMAALGISAGCLVHVCAGAIGLSALLTASATLFTAVKWMGAGYLLYLGITMLLSRAAAAEDDRQTAPKTMTLSQIFWQGALTNVLNPKVALFFLAFLPQFVDADAAHGAIAFLLLGLIFVVNGTLWCLLVAAFAARAAVRIRRSRAAIDWINRALGGFFVFLGVRLALAQTR